MTESKPPPQGRIVRQPGGSIVATPTATGHTYLQSTQYSQFITQRPKPESGTTTAVPLSITTSSVTTQLRVPLLSLTKPTLPVVTTKNSAIHTAPRPYASIAVNPTLVDSNVKPNVKPGGVPKVSHVKQVTDMQKTITTTSLNEHIAQVQNAVSAQTKKPIDVKHVLIGPGLLQPMTSKTQHFQHQITKTNHNAPVLGNAPRSHAVPASWVIHQQDQTKTTAVAPPRTKPPVVVRSVHQVDATHSSQANAATVQDLSKKHSITHQPKTTISIMPALSEVHQRNLPISVSSVNKPVYQIMTPTFQAPLSSQVNPVKKLQTMIVTHVASSSSVSTGFVSSGSAASSGQITVLTGDAGVTYVPAPTPPAVTNSGPIPIAKVYPQQQPGPRVSVSTTSGRLSVPVITSAVSARTCVASAPRSTPTVLQVGSIKSSTITSTVMAAPTTIVSTIPVTLSKTSTTNPLVCWSPFIPPYQHAMPIPTTSSDSGQVAAITLTSTLSQQTIPSTAAARTPSHVFLVDNSRATQLQSAGTTAPILQVSDVGRGSLNNPPGMGPTAPTVSPKPAILRRQRPDTSGALKKLSFQSSPSNFAGRVSQKPVERRAAPYHFNRPKVIGPSDSKTNEIAVMIQPGAQLSDKNEIKPVLANQVHGKQVTSNGFAPIKVSGIKSTGAGQFSVSDSKEQTFSIHSVNIDMKVKTEPGSNAYQSPHSKSEPVSASQILQYQSQSMHTYAAESPQTPHSLPHRVLTQASGQHIKTNTIYANRGAYSNQRRYNVQANSRGKATHVIKPTAHLSGTGPSHQSTQRGSPYAPHGNPGDPQNNSVSSFLHSRPRPEMGISDRPPPVLDRIKKEHQSHAGLTTGPPHVKTQPPDAVGGHTHNHFPHHTAVNMSVGQAWTHVNNADPMAGLSPRKRPRKQTHVVSEVPPDVEMMEDEESTDDADECEDEPMADLSSLSRDTNATPLSRVPGHKLHTPRVTKTEGSSKKSIKGDPTPKSTRSESLSSLTSELKPPTEYTDDNGVRYVVTRKRPAVSVLNKLKPSGRSIANHFMRYTDIKVKDKKVTISDLASDRKRLKGIKVARLASQLNDMVECEKDVWQRMQTVYNGLVEFKKALVGDTTFDDSNSSPIPGTPVCLSNSFNKSRATPRSARSNSVPGILENGPLCSPVTPLDRRAHKVQGEIVKIEELAQANLQRCQVVSDQILETKAMLLKSLDHRQLASDLLDTSTGQKSQTASVSTPSTKRMPKKKNNS